jgi:deoxyribodipyrimidine photo-lyase
VLRQAGVRLGHDYPRPIVDHAEARDRALAALKAVTGRGQSRDDD